MKKYLLLLGLLAGSVSFANHCPHPNQVFEKKGNQYVPVAPPGWQWAASWGTPQFRSSDINMNWVMWSSHRMNPYDENRVQCIYGNPKFDGTYGGVLQTVDIIDRQQVANKPGWQSFGEDYFRCVGDVMACMFGE